jgi:hypothetical protein
MFDYQAGEKYKLTLIMVGVAGLLAGIFFTMLLMPTETPASQRRQRVMTRAQMDPDVTGGRFASSPMAAAMLNNSGAATAAPGQVSGPAGHPAGAAFVDRTAAHAFMQQFLPKIWDLGAATAAGSQEWAIAQMTPACRAAYTTNIWTPALAEQIQQSGLNSTFTASTVDVTENMNDGSVVCKVKGVQYLTAANGTQKQRVINVEYMVVQTSEGLKVAGISEGHPGG